MEFKLKRWIGNMCAASMERAICQHLYQVRSCKDDFVATTCWRDMQDETCT